MTARNAKRLSMLLAVSFFLVTLAGSDVFASCGDYVVIGNPTHEAMSPVSGDGSHDNGVYTPPAPRCNGAECRQQLPLAPQPAVPFSIGPPDPSAVARQRNGHEVEPSSALYSQVVSTTLDGHAQRVERPPR